MEPLYQQSSFRHRPETSILHIDTQMSFWWTFRHCVHWKLSYWQLIFVNVCTESYQYGNFRCRQWEKFIKMTFPFQCTARWKKHHRLDFTKMKSLFAFFCCCCCCFVSLLSYLTLFTCPPLEPPPSPPGGFMSPASSPTATQMPMNSRMISTDCFVDT